MSLQKGNPVTVISEGPFKEKHGEVIEVAEDGYKDGNICVEFGEDCKNLFSWNEELDGWIVWFDESDLCKDKG